MNFFKKEKKASLRIVFITDGDNRVSLPRKTLFMIITILMQPFDSVPSRTRQIEMVIYGDKFDRGEIGTITDHFASLLSLFCCSASFEPCS